MKFTEVRFTHPRVVFPRGFGSGQGESVGFLSTRHDEVARRVDSIVGEGPWLVITRTVTVQDGDNTKKLTETRCVPVAAVENATPEGK